MVFRGPEREFPLLDFTASKNVVFGLLEHVVLCVFHCLPVRSLNLHILFSPVLYEHFRKSSSSFTPRSHPTSVLGETGNRERTNPARTFSRAPPSDRPPAFAGVVRIRLRSATTQGNQANHVYRPNDGRFRNWDQQGDVFFRLGWRISHMGIDHHPQQPCLFFVDQGQVTCCSRRCLRDMIHHN